MSKEHAQSSGAMILKFVWGSMFFSQLIFVGLFYSLLGRRQALANPPDFSILFWSGVVAGAISLVLFRKKLRLPALKQVLVINTPEVAVGSLLPWYMGCWGLNAAVTLLGFVHGFLMVSFMAFLPSVTIGLLLQAFMYPRLEALIRSAPASSV